MEEFLEVVLQRSASQQQLVVQLVLAQHAEELHAPTQSSQLQNYNRCQRRPIGSDSSTAVDQFYNYKNSPKISKPKFRKSVAGYFCTSTQYMCANFRKNRTKTVAGGGVVIWKKFDNIQTDISHHTTLCPQKHIQRIYSIILCRTDEFYEIWRTYSWVYSGHNCRVAFPPKSM